MTYLQLPCLDNRHNNLIPVHNLWYINMNITVMETNLLQYIFVQNNRYTSEELSPLYYTPRQETIRQTHLCHLYIIQ